jgi:hypothetical protein
MTYLAVGRTERKHAPLKPNMIRECQHQLQNRKVRLLRLYSEIGLTLFDIKGRVGQLLLVKHPGRLHRLKRRPSIMINNVEVGVYFDIS